MPPQDPGPAIQLSSFQYKRVSSKELHSTACTKLINLHSDEAGTIFPSSAKLQMKPAETIVLLANCAEKLFRTLPMQTGTSSTIVQAGAIVLVQLCWEPGMHEHEKATHRRRASQDD